MEWLSPFFTAVVGGLVVVIVTKILDRRQFISNRWWERKADAYTTLLNALYDMRPLAEAERAHSAREVDLSEERRKHLAESWRRGRAQIERAARIGEFVLSREVHRAVQKINQCSHGIAEDNFLLLAEAETDAIEAGIDEIRELARQDLRIARWHLGLDL